MSKAGIVIVTAIISMFIGCSTGKMDMTDDMNQEIAKMSRYYKSKYEGTLDAYKQYAAATENLLNETQFYDNFDPYYDGPDEMKRRKCIAYNKYREAFNKVLISCGKTPVTPY